MKTFDQIHLTYLSITILFYIIGGIVMRKSNKVVQYTVLIIMTVVVMFGIFFRYAMGLNFHTNINDLNFKILAMEMLQVCNFNFILLPLALIPKIKLFRQYLLFFSIFGAMTSLISVPSSFKSLDALNISIINSWLNHALTVGIGIFIIASRIDKPRIKYIIPVTIGVFIYFSVVAIISYYLIRKGVIMPENSFSFIYDRGKTAGFSFFYKICPVDYFYLYLIFPILIGFFVGLGYSFKKYKIKN